MNEEIMNNTEDRIEEETTDIQVSPETDDNGGLAETLLGIGITVIGGVIVSKALEFAAPKVIGAGKKLISKFQKSKTDEAFDEAFDEVFIEEPEEDE